MTREVDLYLEARPVMAPTPLKTELSESKNIMVLIMFVPIL